MTLNVQTLSNLDTHDMNGSFLWLPLFKHVVALLWGISKYQHEFINWASKLLYRGELPSVLWSLISKILPSFVHIRNAVSLIPFTPMNSSGSHLFKDVVLLCEITKYHQFMIRRVTTDLETVTVLQGRVAKCCTGLYPKNSSQLCAHQQPN